MALGKWFDSLFLCFLVSEIEVRLQVPPAWDFVGLTGDHRWETFHTVLGAAYFYLPIVYWDPAARQLLFWLLWGQQGTRLGPALKSISSLASSSSPQLFPHHPSFRESKETLGEGWKWISAYVQSPRVTLFMGPKFLLMVRTLVSKPSKLDSLVKWKWMCRASSLCWKQRRLPGATGEREWSCLQSMAPKTGVHSFEELCAIFLVLWIL